jgi:hypothetical protein
MGAGRPFRAHLKRDSRLPANDAPALCLCVHADPRVVAESDRESIQQDDANDVARNRGDSKQELIDRIHQYFEETNAAPVVFRWKYKMDETIVV